MRVHEAASFATLTGAQEQSWHESRGAIAADLEPHRAPPSSVVSGRTPGDSSPRGAVPQDALDNLLRRSRPEFKAVALGSLAATGTSAVLQHYSSDPIPSLRENRLPILLTLLYLAGIADRPALAVSRAPADHGWTREEAGRPPKASNDSSDSSPQRLDTGVEQFRPAGIRSCPGLFRIETSKTGGSGCWSPIRHLRLCGGPRDTRNRTSSSGRESR